MVSNGILKVLIKNIVWTLKKKKEIIENFTSIQIRPVRWSFDKNFRISSSHPHHVFLVITPSTCFSTDLSAQRGEKKRWLIDILELTEECHFLKIGIGNVTRRKIDDIFLGSLVQTFTAAYAGANHPIFPL